MIKGEHNPDPDIMPEYDTAEPPEANNVTALPGASTNNGKRRREANEPPAPHNYLDPPYIQMGASLEADVLKLMAAANNFQDRFKDKYTETQPLAPKDKASRWEITIKNGHLWVRNRELNDEEKKEMIALMEQQRQQQGR